MSNIEAPPAEAEYIQNCDASMMDKSMMSNLDMPQAEAEYIQDNRDTSLIQVDQVDANFDEVSNNVLPIISDR